MERVKGIEPSLQGYSVKWGKVGHFVKENACKFFSYLHYLHSLWHICIVRNAHRIGTLFISTLTKKNDIGLLGRALMIQAKRRSQKSSGRKRRRQNTGARRTLTGGIGIRG
jgi:hypothetical protein